MVPMPPSGVVEVKHHSRERIHRGAVIAREFFDPDFDLFAVFGKLFLDLNRTLNDKVIRKKSKTYQWQSPPKHWSPNSLEQFISLRVFVGFFG